MIANIDLWLAKWSGAPVGSARLTVAIIVAVCVTVGVVGFVSIGFWTLVSTSWELRRYDEAAAFNLKNRAVQMQHLEQVCARR